MITYLSKSNRANPDDVMMLRHDLMKLNDTVIEHKGGQWDPNIINPCNRVIAVHPADQEFTAERCVMGRGQFSEADLAITVIEIPHFVYHEGMLYPTKRIEKIPGKDSWQAYAYFHLGTPEKLNPARPIL